MANTGTLKSYIAEGNHTYNGAHWFVKWSSTQLSNGVTQVTWRLGKGGRSETSRWVQTRAKLQFTGSKSITYVSGTNAVDSEYDTGKLLNNVNARFDEPDVTVASGKFNISHATNGSGSFIANFNVVIDANNIDNFQSNEPKATLDTNYPYIRCEAPTSVSITEARQKPDGEITVKWSGAESGGNANPIAGYNIEYKIGSGNWQLGATVETSNSSGNKKITIPSNAKRGVNLYARVQTIGKQSGYSSEGKTVSSNTCFINRKPGPPTVTVTIPDGGKGADSLKVPYGGRRIIKATVGKDDDGTSGLSVNFKIGSDGTLTTLGKDETIEVNKSATYYFYTYDNLEYSSSVKEAFVVNTSPPSFSIGKHTKEALISNNNNSGKDYIVSHTIETTSSGGQSENNVYTFSLYYSSSANGTYNKVKDIQQTSSASLTIKDIRTIKAPTYNSGYYYKIYITRNDGIESSATKELGPYYVTKIPACMVEVDDTNTSNVSTYPYFSNKFKITTEKDAGYNKVEFQLLNEKNDTAFENTDVNLNATLDMGTSVARGSNYTIRVRPKSSTFTPSTTNRVGSVYRVLLPSLGNNSSLGDAKLINPYTSEGKNLSFLNFFGTITPTNEQLKQYGCSEKSTTFKIAASYGSKSSVKEITRASWALAGDTEATYYIPITSDDYADLFNNLDINRNSSSNSRVNMTLSFVTKHGNTISTSFSQEVCYVTNGTTPVMETEDEFSTTSYWNETTKLVTFLCQGCKIDLANIKLDTIYHDIAQVQIQIGDENFSTVVLDQIELIRVDVAGAIKGFALPTITLPYIRTDIENTYARVRVTNSAGQTSNWKKQLIGLTTRRLTAGTGRLTNPLWDEGGKVKLTFQCTDPGYNEAANNNFTAALCYDNDELIEPKKYFVKGEPFTSAVSSQMIIFEDKDVGWTQASYQKLMVKCTSQLYPCMGDGPTIVWYAPVLVVYKASPTLSYRKNHIGINCSFSQDDNLTNPVLAVKAHQNQNKIYFVNATQKITIDLVDMSVDGAILDGGTWQ